MQKKNFDIPGFKNCCKWSNVAISAQVKAIDKPKSTLLHFSNWLNIFVHSGISRFCAKSLVS